MDIQLKRTRPTLAIAALMFSVVGCQQQAPPPATSTRLMAIETPPPAYPPELACDDVGGKVVLMLTVGTDGRPTQVRLLESSREAALDAAAQEAVQQWRFEPATRNGQPVTSQLNVPVTFTPPAPRPPSCFVLDEQAKSTLVPATEPVVDQASVD